MKMYPILIIINIMITSGEYQNVLAYVAGSIGCIAALPQLYRILKTRQTKDLSLATIAMVLTSLSMWEIWGILQKSTPVIVTNGVSIALNSIIFGIKLKNEFVVTRSKTEETQRLIQTTNIGISV